MFALVRCSLAVPAVLPASVHFAQTLRFSSFIACPRASLEFEPFWAQYHALAEVWRTCVLLTSFFLDWIGPWRSRVQKSALLNNFSRAHFGNDYKNWLKAWIVYSECHFVTSRCGLKPIAKLNRKSKLSSPNVILCTRSRLIFSYSKITVGKRFWLQHVCKVCA